MLISLMLEKLRIAMRQHEIQTLWVSNPANVRYLSNFSSPEDGKVLVTLEEAFLITDDRYTIQAEQESKLEIKSARAAAVLEFVSEVVKGRPTGFEANDTTYKQFDALREKLNAPLRPVENLVENLRAIKTEQELEFIREAARLTDSALEAVLHKLVPGAMVPNRLVNELNDVITNEIRDAIAAEATDAQQIFELAHVEGVLEDSSASQLLSPSERHALVNFIEQRKTNVMELVGAAIGRPLLPLGAKA